MPYDYHTLQSYCIMRMTHTINEMVILGLP